jgi:NADH-quinone oxidoreductase subunit E
MSYKLSDSVKERIEREAAKYPSRRAAVKSALRYAQQEFGWVSEDVIRAVAEILELQPIQVLEVATFYDMFYTAPVGRHQIRVCTNVSCKLRGADSVLEHLENKLGVAIGGTTEDGRISLFEAECLGACGGAPMLVCGDQYFENLSIDEVDEMLTKLD